MIFCPPTVSKIVDRRTFGGVIMSIAERLAHALPGVASAIMRAQVNSYARAAPARPHRYSLWSPGGPDEKTSDGACGEWTSWPGLFDKSYTSRHLGPAPADTTHPQAQDVLGLFERRGAMRPGRSSALFALFAQWFTDSFLRTLHGDRRRTDSNHEIDLCQVYGLDERSTNALRTHRDGQLKMRETDRGLLPPLLFRDGAIDPAFLDLTYLRPAVEVRDGAPVMVDRAAKWRDGVDSLFGTGRPGPMTDAARRDAHYALGLDRGGSTIVYSAINTVFMREHNAIARKLKAEHRGWDDERLFQTARLINMRQVLTIVVEDYISHIAGAPLWLDRSFAEGESWYRSNRTSIEFNLLYRWHGMVPDFIRLAGVDLDHFGYRFNNALIESHGVGAILGAASRVPAGRAELGNTPAFLMKAEEASLGMARQYRLQGFNAYRRRFGMEPYGSIEELAGDAPWLDQLAETYRHVDDVEFTVGLFAEKRGEEDIFGDTLMTMVAHDAFTHILTNPLLAEEVHCPDVYTDVGLALIEERATFAKLVARNCEDEEAEVAFAVR